MNTTKYPIGTGAAPRSWSNELEQLLQRFSH